ncbi:MAG: peptide deformylase [Bacteroidetes bacterium]|jgi:peptide deformylase|nr:peptide deformylase [Bacteroidota bacterium]MDA3944458.1 peptide deformylase [Bacteroidota bacterium]
MILPIVAYGHPTLKKVGVDIEADYPELQTLIENMWETMYAAAGVGLAAPQVNKSIRLFVIDASPFAEEHPVTKDFKKVFINAHIVEEQGEAWTMGEGCLSLPGMNEEVTRKPSITIRYLDEDFEPYEETFDGILARIIQHEYDHINGILYVDRLPSLKRVLLKGKLRDISEGKVDVDYRMTFPRTRKKVR